MKTFSSGTLLAALYFGIAQYFEATTALPDFFPPGLVRSLGNLGVRPFLRKVLPHFIHETVSGFWGELPGVATLRPRLR